MIFNPMRADQVQRKRSPWKRRMQLAPNMCDSPADVSDSERGSGQQNT
jgi:hypothetical protein